jgi:L-xylulokinase
MTNRYLLGIDAGTTVTKACLFDLAGREVKIASRKVEALKPLPTWSERNMDRLWADTSSVIREVIDKAAVRCEDIAGIGCAGHGNGLYLLDKQGRPLRNAIQSVDGRARTLLNEWEQNDIRGRVFPYTPQVFYPAQTAPLLAWLKHHDPETYAQIGTVLLAKDYLNYCLTGVCVTDYSDMASANLMDVTHQRYSQDLLRIYGLEEIYDALPPLCHSTQVMGYVTTACADLTGLHAGTPVVAGMIDAQANGIGAGMHQPGDACVIVGSWSCNEVVTAQPVISRDLFLSFTFADPQHWFLLEGSPTSATNLEWFAQQFCSEERIEAEQRVLSVYEVCSEKIARIPIEDSTIIFHPFLYGSDIAQAQAGFYGITGWHTRHHLLRALYEGIVFGHRHHLDKLKAAGAHIDTIKLTGGGAKSPVWSQMFADVFNTPVDIPASSETGALGAAMTTGVGVGLYKDYHEAVQYCVSTNRTHIPNTRNAAIYQERYEAYHTIAGLMQPHWNKA